MRVYDEDAFFGSGEYEVLTVSEVLEYLTEEEESLFNKLVDLAEKRRRKAETKSRVFSRGYSKAKEETNSYKGNFKSYRGRSYDMDCIEEAYSDCIQFEYFGG